MKVGVGHSEDVDSIDAIREAIEQCKEKLGDAKPDVALLFSAICYEYEDLLDEFQKEYPGVQLIGCTTDAELSSVNSFLEDSLTLLCIASENVQFSTGSSTKLSEDYHAAVKDALDQAKQGLIGEPKICITYYDSLTASGTILLDILQEQLGDNVVVFGGAAGDQWEMKETYQFHNKEVLNDSVTVLLISGDVLHSSGVSTGRQTFGKTFTITKAENNIIYEIDNQSAVNFYQKYVGRYQDSATGNPLAVMIGKDSEFYLRSPFSYNEDGSITFFADVPEGSTVKLTQSTRDDIIKGAEEASKKALAGFDTDKIDLVLVSSCAGRRILLGTRVKEEIDLLRTTIPADTGIMGFYTYGEICPVIKEDNSKFHNETIAILLLGEK